jgi:hypothetical protein
VVLLAELNQQVNAIFPSYQRSGQAMLRDLAQHRERIAEAERQVSRAQDRLDEAAAPLTPEELQPRNPEEANWDSSTRSNRREVERSRRIRRAQDARDAARDHLHQRQAECRAAEVRRDEAMAEFGLRAHRIRELYRQRIATYVDALARSHPDGRTLYPLLSLPEVRLPDWVPATDVTDGPSPRSGVSGEEE